MSIDSELASRRELVRAFHKSIIESYTPTETAIAKLRDTYPSAGFGVYDDDELERKRDEHKAAYQAQLSLQEHLKWTWQLVVQVFGKDTCDMAIEEGERRIGELPYVE